MKKEEFFNLTPAETTAVIHGFCYRNDLRSANFRELFALTFNQWSKHQRRASQLWPLATLDENEELTAEEMYSRNAKIIEAMNMN